MSDFNRIQDYYKAFDESERLLTPAGALEFELTLRILKDQWGAPRRILDLGGGPGRYTAALLEAGHRVVLADLSHDLLDDARQLLSSKQLEAEAILQANATQLSVFQDAEFEGVLCLGPFYHLQNATDRHAAAQEIYRVLQPGALACVAFVPYATGLQSMIYRAAHTEQLDLQRVRQVIETGAFNNATSSGFQEGIFLQPEAMKETFESVGFKTQTLRTIKGYAYSHEAEMLSLKKDKPELFEAFVQGINAHAEDTDVMGMGGHALYLGVKPL